MENQVTIRLSPKALRFVITVLEKQIAQDQKRADKLKNDNAKADLGNDLAFLDAIVTDLKNAGK